MIYRNPKLKPLITGSNEISASFFKEEVESIKKELMLDESKDPHFIENQSKKNKKIRFHII